MSIFVYLADHPMNVWMFVGLLNRVLGTSLYPNSLYIIAFITSYVF